METKGNNTQDQLQPKELMKAKYKLTEEAKKTNLQISEYFSKLPPEKLDQSIAIYEPGKPDCAACIAAHLAFILKRPSTRNPNEFSMYDGIPAFVSAMGFRELKDWEQNLRVDMLCSIAEKILCSAGAPLSPFSFKPWNVDPAEIFKELSQ